MDDPEAQGSAKNIAFSTTLKQLDLDLGKNIDATLHLVDYNVEMYARTVWKAFFQTPVNFLLNPNYCH